MKMTKLKYEVRFVTPAFLGNAEQSGQWRQCKLVKEGK